MLVGRPSKVLYVSGKCYSDSLLTGLHLHETAGIAIGWAEQQ